MIKPAASVCPECWQTYHSSNCQARPPVKRVPLFTRDDLVRVAVAAAKLAPSLDVEEQCKDIVAELLGDEGGEG